jgi:CDP-glucose 4,6-dehydratase
MEAVVRPADALKSFAGRRVLVTGHTGFKGSWLCLWLTRLGARVSGFSDTVPTDPSHFSALQLDLDDCRGDICDADAIDGALVEAKPEIIFHFAAQSLVRKAYDDPVETYRTNVLGTAAVLEAARRHGVSAVIVATTDKVYRNDESGRRYHEADELGGSDPYSASKACIELMVRPYRENVANEGKMLVATVRAGNVIGGGDWAQDRLLPDLMRAAFDGKTALVRNPQSTRPWQHVLDVLAGYLMIGARLLEGDAAAAEAWNLGPVSDANIRVTDIVTAVQAQLPQLTIDTRANESDRHESGLLQLDSTRAITRLGWRPRWEGEMLQRTVAWYRAFHDGGRPISETQLAEYETALV